MTGESRCTCRRTVSAALQHLNDSSSLEVRTDADRILKEKVKEETLF